MKTLFKLTFISLLFVAVQAILALDLAGFEGLNITPLFWVLGICTMLFLAFLLFRVCATVARYTAV